MHIFTEDEFLFKEQFFFKGQHSRTKTILAVNEKVQMEIEKCIFIGGNQLDLGISENNESCEAGIQNEFQKGNYIG